MTLRTGTNSVGREYRYYTCSTKARQGATGYLSPETAHALGTSDQDLPGEKETRSWNASLADRTRLSRAVALHGEAPMR